MQKFNEDSIRFKIHKLRCQLWDVAEGSEAENELFVKIDELKAILCANRNVVDTRGNMYLNTYA